MYGQYILRKIRQFTSLNDVVYLYKRNNWIFDLNKVLKRYQDIKIEKPVFLLGTQGGGLTLVSRMLRRHKHIVSVTGNYKYWSGADEMNSVLGPILPDELKSIEYIKQFQDKYKYPNDWHCGIDENLEYFRKTEKDVTDDVRKNFRDIIKWIIYKNSINKIKSRFTDKSQTFSLKVSFINEILKDCNPKFILITRNPYAMCYRIARGTMYRFDNNSFEDRLILACQNWKNYMKYALEDGNKINSFMMVKFEDILSEPVMNLRNICNFIELEFSEVMIPSKNDKMPFGSQRRKRWYPLNTKVNDKYLQQITKDDLKIINKECEDYIKITNYELMN